MANIVHARTCLFLLLFNTKFEGKKMLTFFIHCWVYKQEKNKLSY